MHSFSASCGHVWIKSELLSRRSAQQFSIYGSLTALCGAAIHCGLSVPAIYYLWRAPPLTYWEEYYEYVETACHVHGSVIMSMSRGWLV